MRRRGYSLGNAKVNWQDSSLRGFSATWLERLCPNFSHNGSRTVSLKVSRGSIEHVRDAQAGFRVQLYLPFLFKLCTHPGI